MTNKAWKHRERDVASFFGGTRNALSGGNSKVTRADVIHNNLFIECKLRAKHSAIKLWYDTAILAKLEEKIAVSALCDKNRAGLANLLTIYSIATGDSISKIEDNYKGKMYSEFKSDLGDIIVELLTPIQKEYKMLMKDKRHIEVILKNGAEKARHKAYKTLDKVYRKIGLVKRM